MVQFAPPGGYPEVRLIECYHGDSLLFFLLKIVNVHKNYYTSYIYYCQVFGSENTRNNAYSPDCTGIHLEQKHPFISLDLFDNKP